MRYSTFLVAAFVGLASVARAQDTTQAPTRLPSSKVTVDLNKVVTVQNDRTEGVRLFLEAGRAETLLGTIAPNSTGELQLPGWAIKGKRTITMLAVAENSAQLFARYDVPVVPGQMIGLLVAPAAGLPAGDSLLIALPKGIGSAATVTIDNGRPQPVTIFAEQGLRLVKLGEVAAHELSTLPLPTTMLKGKESVRIFARPQGGAERSTQALKVKEGDRIAVIVM